MRTSLLILALSLTCCGSPSGQASGDPFSAAPGGGTCSLEGPQFITTTETFVELRRDVTESTTLARDWYCQSGAQWLAEVFPESEGSCAVTACADGGCAEFVCDPAGGCVIADQSTCSYDVTLEPNR